MSSHDVDPVKEERLARLCERRHADGIVLRRRSNIAWLAGADVHVDSGNPLGIAALVWKPGSRVALTDVIEARRLFDEELGDAWEIVSRGWWERGPEPEGGRLLHDWPEDIIAPLRWSLTPPEIAAARGLGQETAELMQRTLHDVRPGLSEHDVAGAYGGELLKRGINPRVLLVAGDRRIASYRHPIPTGLRFEQILMLVVCAERGGLIVCLTRLVHFGALPDELRRRHEAVCHVDRVLHEATRPGASYGDVLMRGIAAYAEVGFPDEWRLHHQGGPMGYECRDFVATPGETRSVVEHQLVGWNPSITGTKSEDTILSDGEVLTSMPDWPTLNGRPAILVR